jgi:fibronectin type 3 domain-containing protein
MHTGYFQRLILFLGIAVVCSGKSAQAASPPGDVVGKVTVGYQGWFACTGDGAPIGTWWHYSGGTQPPVPITLSNSIHCWPDMRQFANGYQTGFTNFGNGQSATLFSSYDSQTVNTHFRWMAENGLDTAALQRFNPTGGEGPTRDVMATRVRTAAETYGRKFYIMYDVSGWTTMQTDIKVDWINKMSALTSSSAYAFQNGKPVVCIWGFGFDDPNHTWDAPTCADVINWFKGQGCYVIGGVPTHWRTENSDSRSNFLSAYSAFNMISPWMVGRIGNSGDSDNFYNNVNLQDQAYCNANGIDYQPCVLPGDTGQRAHGDFMWRQFYNMQRAGCQGIYISMFDEFNEGNQIACTAESASMSPIGSSALYFTLDQDGTSCSSDYYLRLTGDGGRMFKGQMALTTIRPTVPMLPLQSPIAPAGLTANAGNARVTLTWTPSAGATSYNIMRATESGGPITTFTNVGLVGYTDTNVVNGILYYYAVTTVNSLGESANSKSVSALPTAFYQVNSGGSAASPFGADAFFSGSSAGSTSSAIDTSGVTNPAPQAVYQTERWNNNTYTFPNLSSGTSYKVRLHFAEIFYNAAGIRRFHVFINGTQVLTNYDIFADAGAKNKATIKEYTAVANGSGQIVIQYVNGASDNAKSSGIEILPLNPPPLLAPTDPAAAAVSSSAISLSWTAPASAASYNVMRGTVDTGPYTTIATGVTATGYWDTGLTPNTTYYYVVSAVNTGGESTNSIQASATTQAPPPPNIPVGLAAASGNGQVILSWMPASGADSYYVRRATISGGPYTTITNLAMTTYTNAGLVNNTTYYYVVSATNAIGASTNSVEVSSIPSVGIASASSENPPSETAAKAFDGSVSTKWLGAGTNGWLQYYFRGAATTVNRYDLSSANDVPGRDPKTWQFQGSQDGINWTTLDARTNEIFASRLLTKQYPITNTTAYGYYRLNITANNGDANNMQLSEMAFTFFIGAPANLTATAGAGQAVLSWTASSGATGYNLKRSTVSNGPYTVIATNLNALAYTNIGLANGTIYYFVVSATNGFSESINSAEANVRPVSATSPPITFVANGNQMQLNWPLDHVGWHLEMQTNALNADGWVTVSNSATTNQLSVPIDPARASVFFRLVYP